MADSENDEDLVRSAQAGDSGAFDRLVERYAPRMFRIIRAQVREASVAEDLVQEIFLSAFVALPKFRLDSGFYTWIYRILLHTVGQHQRKSARRRELDARSRKETEAGTTADPAPEVEETRNQVRRALADLPEDYRVALLLREWADLTYAEIAQVLGCPIGTVDSRISRARQMLAERLAPHEDL